MIREQQEFFPDFFSTNISVVVFPFFSSFPQVPVYVYRSRRGGLSVIRRGVLSSSTILPGTMFESEGGFVLVESTSLSPFCRPRSSAGEGWRGWPLSCLVRRSSSAVIIRVSGCPLCGFLVCSACSFVFGCAADGCSSEQAVRRFRRVGEGGGL